MAKKIFSIGNHRDKSEPEIERSKSKTSATDRVELARTGKVQVLQRNFGFVSILGLSLVILSTWLGVLALLEIGLENGGPAGIVYSFIIVWAGNLATFTTLAELASLAPTAGGQYHWVSILAPTSYQKLLSYVTGWLTVTGWVAGVASSAYVGGGLLQGLIEISDPSYQPHLWHTTLLTYGILFVAVVATTLLGSYLPWTEIVFLVVYILGFFAILIPLLCLGPHLRSSDEVFTHFINAGGWSTQGLSFCVGITGNAFAFLGADSVYHMSEEIRNSATTVPKALVWSIVLNGIVGFAMEIGLLFSADSFQTALDSGFVYPFIDIFLQATRSRGVSAGFMAIIVFIDLGVVTGCLAASSRMLWSFARDRGVPFWISRIGRTSALPYISIFIVTTISVLLTLISIGSPVAFNDVISLTVSAFYSSYLVTASHLLWRRLQGSIQPYEGLSPTKNFQKLNMPGSGGQLTWGPWKVKEPFGTIINAFAIVYLTFVVFFSFWPPAVPVTASTMNYSCLVFGFVAIVSALYYILIARKEYTGPVIDEDLQVEAVDARTPEQTAM